MIDRREFTAGLLSLAAIPASKAEAQTAQPGADLKTLTSGVFQFGPAKGSAGRVGHQYLLGMLTAGNVRLEMHETIQQPNAEHEAIGHHLHNEVWCVQRGTASLFINGTEHRMDAGDVGLVCAGDQHWIKNAGPTELAYFVLAIGPRE